MQRKITSLYLPIVISCCFLCCTRVDRIPDISLRSQKSAYISQNQIDLTIRLIINDELKNAKYERGNIISPIGGQVTKNSIELSEIIFRKVQVEGSISTDSANSNSEISEATLTPRIVAIEISYGATASGDASHTMAVEWLLQDTDKRIVWVDTVNGEGRGPSGNLFTAVGNAEEQTKMLLNDIFLKSFEAITSSPEIMKFAALKSSQRVIASNFKESTINHTFNQSQPSSPANDDSAELPANISGTESHSSISSSSQYSAMSTSTKATVKQNALAILPINASKALYGVSMQYYTATKRAVTEKLASFAYGYQEKKPIYNFYDHSQNRTVLDQDTPEKLWTEIGHFSDARKFDMDFACFIGEKVAANFILTCDLFGQSIRVYLVDVSNKKIYQDSFIFSVHTGYTNAPKAIDIFFQKYQGLLIN